MHHTFQVLSGEVFLSSSPSGDSNAHYKAYVWCSAVTCIILKKEFLAVHIFQVVQSLRASHIKSFIQGIEPWLEGDKIGSDSLHMLSVFYIFIHVYLIMKHPRVYSTCGNKMHPSMYLSSSQSNQQWFRLYHGCVSEMAVLSYSVIYYIYMPGTLGPCFHYWCSVYGICKWSDTLWPAGRVRLFADYATSLSSLCRPIWRHWSVCLRLRQFSPLVFIQYMGLCVFSLSNSPVMIVRMGALSYYHDQTGSMSHWPLFRVRSWNNGMCCKSYYVLMTWWHQTTSHNLIQSWLFLVIIADKSLAFQSMVQRLNYTLYPYTLLNENSQTDTCVCVCM